MWLLGEVSVYRGGQREPNVGMNATQDCFAPFECCADSSFFDAFRGLPSLRNLGSLGTPPVEISRLSIRFQLDSIPDSAPYPARQHPARLPIISRSLSFFPLFFSFLPLPLPNKDKFQSALVTRENFFI